MSGFDSGQVCFAVAVKRLCSASSGRTSECSATHAVAHVMKGERLTQALRGQESPVPDSDIARQKTSSSKCRKREKTSPMGRRDRAKAATGWSSVGHSLTSWWLPRYYGTSKITNNEKRKPSRLVAAASRESGA